MMTRILLGPSRFMVRGGAGGRGTLYPGDGFSKFVAQNYEY